MRLKDCENWRAVHFEDRTILSKDFYLFGKLDWEELIYDMEVEPIPDRPGHYRPVTP